MQNEMPCRASAAGIRRTNMRIALWAVLLAAVALPGLRAAETAEPGKAQPVVKVGQPAPDFSLLGLSIDPDTGVATPDDKKPFRLADHAGKRPVVLIFSSFT
jgi:hypothetical protein